MARWHGWHAEAGGEDYFVLRVERRSDKPRPTLTLAAHGEEEVLAYFRSTAHAELAMAAIDRLLGFTVEEVERAIEAAEARVTNAEAGDS